MKYFCCSNFLLHVFFSWLRVSDLILFFILSELFYFFQASKIRLFPTVESVLFISALYYQCGISALTSLLLLYLQSEGCTKYAESTDEFCIMLSPVNSDQDLY